MEENDLKLFLIIINVVTTVLFLVSELLGSSTCEYNGVCQFIIGDCLPSKKKIYVDISIREHIDPESQPLLEDVI